MTVASACANLFSVGSIVGGLAIRGCCAGFSTPQPGKGESPKHQPWVPARRAPGRSRYRGQLEEDTLENEENDELPHETDFDQHTDDQLSSGEPDADSFV
jgi:hypothetical protein